MGSARSSLAAVRLFYDWDIAGADRACKRAVALSPSDPFVLNNGAWYLLAVRRSDEALDGDRDCRLASCRLLSRHAMLVDVENEWKRPPYRAAAHLPIHL